MGVPPPPNHFWALMDVLTRICMHKWKNIYTLEGLSSWSKVVTVPSCQVSLELFGQFFTRYSYHFFFLVTFPISKIDLSLSKHFALLRNSRVSNFNISQNGCAFQKCHPWFFFSKPRISIRLTSRIISAWGKFTSSHTVWKLI